MGVKRRGWKVAFLFRRYNEAQGSGTVYFIAGTCNDLAVPDERLTGRGVATCQGTEGRDSSPIEWDMAIFRVESLPVIDEASVTSNGRAIHYQYRRLVAWKLKVGNCCEPESAGL